MKNNNIQHPRHYNREGAMECFDEFVLIYGIEAAKYACLFNIHKYRYRAADKNGEEDLKKSDWYLNKYKELAEKDLPNPKIYIDPVPAAPYPYTPTYYDITCSESKQKDN